MPDRLVSGLTPGCFQAPPVSLSPFHGQQSLQSREEPRRKSLKLTEAKKSTRWQDLNLQKSRPLLPEMEEFERGFSHPKYQER